jgi:hypothetical protein
MVQRCWALAGRWWRRSGALGIAVAVAATPAAWFVVTIGGGGNSKPGFGWLATAALVTVLFCITGVVVAGLTAVVRVAARNRGVRVPAVTSVLLVLVQAAVMVVLDRLAPFRPGLLSVLLYSGSAMLIADGVVVTGRRVRVACAVAVAGVLALAVPVRLLQQAVGAWEWTHLGGVPSRAWLQVINLPGMSQQPYQWEAGTRTLTAYFDDPADEGYVVETVIPGRNVPPGKWSWAHLGSDTTSCTLQRAGLWQCTDPGTVSAAYVLRSGPVTIILIGTLQEGLPDAIRSAHPASNAELWSRSGLAPRTVVGCLLL